MNLCGHFDLYLMNSSTNTWTFYGSTCRTVTQVQAFSGRGRKSLSAELDRIRITATNGTDTFDAGSINIQYQ